MVTEGKPAQHRAVVTLSVFGVVISAAVGVHTCCTPIIPPIPPDPVYDAAPPPNDAPPDVSADSEVDAAPARCVFVSPKKRGGRPRDPRIVGGTPTPPGAYPFAVGLATSSRFQYCGGTVVADKFVLTAAHCQVEAGDYALVGSSNLTQASMIRVQESRIHPGFSNDTLDYDVAIAVLERDSGVPIVPIAASINTLDATVIGWGKTCENCATTSFLREVSIPLWEYCPAEYAISDRQLCAGEPGGGKDSCQGDSGGALLTWNMDHWEQLGIVSWGVGCARPGSPGVYTDLRDDDVSRWVKECSK